MMKSIFSRALKQAVGNNRLEQSLKLGAAVLFPPAVLAYLVGVTLYEGLKVGVMGMEQSGKTTLLNSELKEDQEFGERVSFLIREIFSVSLKEYQEFGERVSYPQEVICEALKENNAILFVFDVSLYLTDLAYAKKVRAYWDLLEREHETCGLERKSFSFFGSHVDLLKQPEEAFGQVLASLKGKPYEKLVRENLVCLNLRDKEGVKKRLQS